MKIPKHQKVLQIYDYATNLGYILLRQSNDNQMQKLGTDMVSIGAEAIDKYRVKKNKKMIQAITKKLDELYKDQTEIDVLEGLSISFLGLSELVIMSGTKLYSNKLRNITLTAILKLDPELIMEGIYIKSLKRFNNWLH